MHQVEDEYHCVLLCPSYIDLRRSCIPRYYWTWAPLQNKINY